MHSAQTRSSNSRLQRQRLARRQTHLIVLAVVLVLSLWFVISSKKPQTVDPEAGEETGQDEGHIGKEDKPLSALQQQRKDKIAELAEKPNELGTIPIIMYHVIGDTEEEWARTRDNFKKDLERFYALGYSLIPLQSYLSADIDLPKGVSPLVITFDDGTAGQFRLVTDNSAEANGAIGALENKVPDPLSAVGILLDFQEMHTEFGCAATFYVNFPAPFGIQSEWVQKLQMLLSYGMEIGNHTYNHKDLTNASADVIKAEIGSLSNAVFEAIGTKPLSLALPYGGFPKQAQKEHLMIGEYEGLSYENAGVMLVGAEAALSPFNKAVNFAAIPRIRGSEDELSKWLSYLDSSGKRYVSDGDISIITVKAGSEADVSEAFIEDFEIVGLPQD